MIRRKDIKAFRTSQRLSVMFFKTAVGHDLGCVTGKQGPAKLPLPAVGDSIERPALGWKLYRLSEDMMILADCLAESNPKGTWSRILKRMHGILLRQLGKKRVVYLIKQSPRSGEHEHYWHSNVNLVTGASESWLSGAF